MIYFSVEIKNKYIGLSDILWRLAMIYRLGQALSYTYLHQPFSCRRSLSLSMGDRLLRKLIGYRKKDDLYVANFLGLGKSDPRLIQANCPIINLDLIKLLDDESIQNISDLKQAIEQHMEDADSIILNFLITDQFYNSRVRSVLDQLLSSHPLLNGDRTFQNFVSLHYWHQRKTWPIAIPFEPDKLKILVHIRRGDRVWIDLDQKILLLHGNQLLVKTNDETIRTSTKWNQFEKPVDIHTIKTLLHQILGKCGQDHCSVIIISDGYSRAKQEIKSAIKQGKLTLTLAEIQQVYHDLNHKTKELQILAKYPHTSLILGENSQHKLLQSIHAIASANILIKTTGGFTKVHDFLKKPEQPSVLLDATTLNATKIECEIIKDFLAMVGTLGPCS